jgi:hypothetical protein
MKKILFSLISIVAGANAAFSQVAWIEPDPTIATDSITIYVDLSRLDMSKDYHQAIAAHPGPMYIWTWKPFEFPTGSPKVNGLPPEPWKNSNDVLKMTPAPDKGEKVWMYKMIPTEFYEVTASQVYTSGLALLVKPKDGGGFGDPDIKTDDIILKVNPPKTDKGSLYTFPLTLLDDEVTTIIYDNAAEPKPTMKNLPAGEDLFLHIKATAEDANGAVKTYQPSLFLQAHNNPALHMEPVGATQYKLYMIPRKFLNIPSTEKLIDIEIVVRKRNWATDADTGGEKPKLKFGCE